ncbi:MAG TPA: hypothetical protein VLE97_08870 [Gaiellaceae bacterium]|nr:hypothetical protein [Gaiellaceae bacterium]
MIAPATMDALADVVRALGFELRRSAHAVPVGVDFDRAKEQTQFALLRGDEVEFDGTARECSAFLIGWRDLRLRLLAELRAVDAHGVADMCGRTYCRAVDAEGRSCLRPAGHTDLHTALSRWENPQ